MATPQKPYTLGAPMEPDAVTKKPKPLMTPAAPTPGQPLGAQPVTTPQPVSLPGQPLGAPGATAAPAGSMITTNTSQIQPSTGAVPAPVGAMNPIGPGMTGAPPPPMPTPNPYLTPFGPGNDLQTTQNNPTANPRLQQTQSAVDAAAAALGQGPNRMQSAQDAFAAFLGGQGEEFDRRARELTQRNAAGGRLSSGMYGSNLADLGQDFNRNAQREAARLAYDTTGGAIQDQFNTLGALAGLEGQQFGQGAAQRNELRGERGYQNAYGQQGFQNSLTQYQTEQQAQQQAAQQELARLGLLGQFGYGGNPSGLLGQFAGDLQTAAGQTGAGAGDLLSQWLLSQAGG